MKVKELKKILNSLPDIYLDIPVYKLTDKGIDLDIGVSFGDKDGRYEENKITKSTFLLIQ